MLTILLSFTAVSGASPLVQTLHRLGADPQQVRIESLGGDRLQFRIADTQASPPTFGEVQEASIDDIVAWGRRRGFRTASQVLLHDGSVLIADLLAVAPDQWTWGADPLAFGSVRPIFRTVTLPRRLIAGAMFTPPVDPATRDTLASEMRKIAEDDAWWIEEGNQVKGRLLEAKGAADSDVAVGIDQWLVRVRQRAVTLDHARVESLRLGATAAPDRDVNARWMLGFLDGSFVLANALAERDGVVHLQLASNAVAQVEREEFYNGLCLIRPLHPRILYLSDLPPKEHRHQPFLTLQRPLRRNQNVLGGLPRHKDFVFTKSLGVASRSFVVYDIPEGWNRLAAEVALDEAAKGGGSVTFKVFRQSAEDGPWKPAVSGVTVRGEDPPQTVTVPLDDTKRVALVVDFAERGDVLDYANWLNLRLEK